MKLVVLDGYLVNPDGMEWDVQKKFPDLVWYEESAPDEIAQRIGDAEMCIRDR